MDSKVVAPDDLKVLQSLQQTWEVLTKRFGELHYEKKMVESEMQGIDKAFDELEAKRNEVVTRLQTQFATTGTVNLETGEFIPDKN
jgi:hypothetical protein